jgi:hypothetical protein
MILLRRDPGVGCVVTSIAGRVILCHNLAQPRRSLNTLAIENANVFVQESRGVDCGDSHLDIHISARTQFELQNVSHFPPGLTRRRAFTCAHPALNVQDVLGDVLTRPVRCPKPHKSMVFSRGQLRVTY